MTTATIVEVEEKSIATTRQATAIVVANNEQYKSATDFLKIVKAFEKEIEETFNPIIEQAHKAHKEALTQKDKFYKPLLDAERLVKYKISCFLVDQEAKRKAQEDKLRREVEAKQEELQRKAEEARANGKETKAEKYEEKAAGLVAPALASSVDKVEGVSMRDNWTAEVVDISLLPKEYMLPDMIKLNKLAKAMKDTMKIPGVIFKREQIISSTAR